MSFESEVETSGDSRLATDQSDSGHLPALDGVRGVAISLVLVAHLGAILRDTYVGRYLDFGWIGVDLFFVLSGFLITRILTRARSRSNYYRRFYVRRGLRIWPLYYVYTAATLLLLRVLAHFPAGFPTSTATPLWCFLFFVQNLNPASLFSFRDSLFAITWSLCIEEHFYLVWPVCVRHLSGRTLLAGLSVLMLLSPSLRIAAYATLRNSPFSIWYQTIMRFTPLHLDAIAAGCLLSLTWDQVRERDRERIDRWFFGLFFLGLSGSIACLRWKTNAYVFSFCFSALAAMLVGFTGLALTGHCRRMLTNAPLRYLGRISYGVYLIHPAVFVFLQSHHLLARVGWQRHPALVETAAAVVAVTLSVSLAAVSWEFFEKRVLALKGRLVP